MRIEAIAKDNKTAYFFKKYLILVHEELGL
jgi:hypothetical protein